MTHPTRRGTKPHNLTRLGLAPQLKREASRELQRRAAATFAKAARPGAFWRCRSGRTPD